MNAAPIGMTTRKIIVTPCMVKSLVVEVGREQLPSGAASWTRISRASTPPTRKNSSAEAPYMMPIFLWSTVVSHDFQPVLARGREKTPRARVGW